MSCFRRKRTDRTGKKVADRVWTIEFSDHANITRRLSGFTDKTASLELERQIRRLVSLRMGGLGVDAGGTKFLEVCPTITRSRLAEWGIIQGERAAAGKPLLAHIADWRCSRVANGVSRKQIANTATRTMKIVTDCGWLSISDICVGDVERWREAEKGAGAAIQTLNHYLAAIKTFCNWLVKEKRLSENPLAHMLKQNAATDRRRERRSFTVEELGKILAAAATGIATHGMTGAERTLLYRIAFSTGYRWSEIKSLTKESADFSGETATLAIKAADAKNGLDDVLPLPSDLAADLRKHLALHMPNAPIFPRHGRQGRGDVAR